MGKVPSPNEGKICPFLPPGEDLAAPKRRWEKDAEDTGVELLWDGAGASQADSCTVYMSMGTRDQPSKSNQV